jgi:hypothetical protein
MLLITASTSPRQSRDSVLCRLSDRTAKFGRRRDLTSRAPSAADDASIDMTNSDGRGAWTAAAFTLRPGADRFWILWIIAPRMRLGRFARMLDVNEHRAHIGRELSGGDLAPDGAGQKTSDFPVRVSAASIWLLPMLVQSLWAMFCADESVWIHSTPR